MKTPKIVSIILTAGLLTGTVAFSALAQGGKDGDRDYDQRPKVVQRQRRQPAPAVKPSRRAKKVVIRTAKGKPTVVVTLKAKRPLAKKRTGAPKRHPDRREQDERLKR